MQQQKSRIQMWADERARSAKNNNKFLFLVLQHNYSSAHIWILQLRVLDSELHAGPLFFYTPLIIT